MKLKSSELLRLAKGLLEGPDEVLDCRPVTAHLPAAVDAVMEGQSLHECFPYIAAHLKICPQCRREFEELCQLTHTMELGSLLDPASYPSFDYQRISEQAYEERAKIPYCAFMVRFRHYVQTLRKDIVEAGNRLSRITLDDTAPALLLSVKPDISLVPRLVPLRTPPPSQTRQLVYPLEPIDLQVTLNIREFDHHLFTIRGLIETDQVFAGLDVVLLCSDGQQAVDCTKVDDTNTFSFHNISPDKYAICLTFTPEERICLTDVDI